MSSEIHNTGFSGETQFAIAYVAGDPLYLAGDVVETWGTSGRTIADYAISTTWKKGNNVYGDMPADAPSNTYEITFYSQAAGSPTDSDLANVIATQVLEWPIVRLGTILEDTGTTIPAQITSVHSTTDALVAAISAEVLSVLNIYDESKQTRPGGTYPIIEDTSGGAGVYP